MATITIDTIIHAPIERCFLLSLSVDLHTASVSQTHETAIAGITSGIMQLNDTVTWQAKHFGFTLNMTSKIAAHNKPVYFVSEMIKGPFKKLYHQHLFKEENGHTVMTDIFELEAPLGFLGKLAEKWFLVNYMKRFLVIRDRYIKSIAESGEWTKYLQN